MTVSGVSSTFTLQSGAGTKTATFVGTMPASGTKFDIQYPETDPDLSTQTYSEGKLPAGKMKFTASDCTLESTATLTAAYAALRLNLYGIDRKVNSIVVTNTTSTEDPKPSYTLTCTTPVTVGNTEETATSFLMVVPTGETAWAFSALATTTAVDSPTYILPSYPNSDEKGVIVANGYFITASAKTFAAGSILDMPAKCLTTIWAPVNCGYDATNYPYGLLYQWGRKVGGGYDSDEGKQVETTAIWDSYGYNKTPDDGKFYASNATPFDWYTNSADKQMSEWPMTDPSETTGIGNPCPNGWRVPTVNEMGVLCFEDWNSFSHSGTVTRGSWNDINKGWAFNDIFLPAAGYRFYSNGKKDFRGTCGFYWASSTDGISGWGSDFSSASIQVNQDHRANGYSVRCVYDGKKHGFAISATKNVEFSKGNLQWSSSNGTSTATSHTVNGGGTKPGTWRFATNQYDYVGFPDQSTGNVYGVGGDSSVQCNNIPTSDGNYQNYRGWLDVFGYGTSGYDDNYPPYCTTFDYTLYLNQDLTGEYAEYDWGRYNSISNGGDKPGIWRTLSASEWDYLLTQRTDHDAKLGYALIKSDIGGTTISVGLIILPDEWSLPEGMTFTPVSSNNEYSLTGGTAPNQYTESGWVNMENAGAIFLPITGWRRGNVFPDDKASQKYNGYYMTTTLDVNYPLNSCQNMEFASGSAPTIAGDNYKRNALAIRLVKDLN